MKLVNNTLIIENGYINDGFFSQEDADYLKREFGIPGNFFLNTEEEIKYIIKSTSHEVAEELISTEFNTDDVVISYSELMQRYLIRMKNTGTHGQYIVPAVLVAINKVYRNVKEAEKTAKYLKAMGFGLHKEAD